MRMVYESKALSEVFLMKGVLDAEGIHAEVRGEDMVAMQIPTTPSLWVEESEADRARAAIAAVIQTNPDAEQVLEQMEAAEDADGDEDEDGAETMSDLFLVADRLWHDPFRVDLLEELSELSEVLATVGPPFGVEEGTWSRLGVLARELIASQEVEDEEVFRKAAHNLRDFLRDFV